MKAAWVHPCSLLLYLLEKQTECCQNDQKSKIEGGKQQNIVAVLALIMLAVFPKGDQTGKGRDQRTNTADVDTQQKLLVVVCELGQKNRGGYIADDLTGQHRYQQGIFLQKIGEQ